MMQYKKKWIELNFKKREFKIETDFELRYQQELIISFFKWGSISFRFYQPATLPGEASEKINLTTPFLGQI